MNASNIDNKPRVAKETKNKIKVEFERTPLKDRLKARFATMSFVKKVVWFIFRLVLLVGVSYVVLMPFIQMVTRSFMDAQDFLDPTVWYVPKHYTLDTYKAIITDLNYFEAFFNTFLLSSMCAILQTFFCCLIAYGLAKFKFKGNKLIFLAVIFTMVVPHEVLRSTMDEHFREFDIFGIFQLLGGGGITIFGHNIPVAIDIFPDSWSKVFTANGIYLRNTFWPLILLSLTGLAFKNGLYIFLLRQFFRGVPDELEESAYIDGSNTFRTFLQIILPLSVPMMITVFMFAFSWQWTDDFYTEVFFSNQKVLLMPDVIGMPSSLNIPTGAETNYNEAVYGTSGILIIIPLVILYLFGQRYIVQGIERSGITG